MHFRKARCARGALWGRGVRIVAVLPDVFALRAARARLVEAEQLAPEEPLAVLHDFRCRFPVDGNYAMCDCRDLWVCAAVAP